MFFGHSWFILQLFVCELAFAIRLPKRKFFWLRYALGVAVCAFGCAFIPGRDRSTITGYIFTVFGMFFATIAVLLCCIKAPVRNIIFSAIAGYAAQHLISSSFWIINIPLKAIFGTITNEWLNSLKNWIVYAAFSVIFYFVFSRRIKDGSKPLFNNVWLVIISAAALGISIILSVVKSAGPSAGADARDYVAFINRIISVYAMLSCLFILLLFFFLISNKKLGNDLATVEQLVHEKSKQYEISKDNINLINIKCHDLKHYIAVIKNVSGEIDNGLLDEIEDAVSVYDLQVETGNEALDVILTEKSLLCKKEKITISCIIDGEKLSFMSMSDIYSLFGNAIDNAIEAVMQLPDVNDRRISIQVLSIGKLVSIHVENRFAGDIIVENGIPVTTKKDKKYHGFGMPSVSLIVEKYNGSLSVNALGGVFTLNILLPLK